MQLTRRALLTAALGLAVTACRPKRDRPQPAGIDMAEVSAALADEQRLVTAYDAAITRLDAVASARLVRERARHVAHLAALTDTLPTPNASPSSMSSVATPGEHLRVLLQRSSQSLQAAAVTAPDGDFAALLASIAAEHAADAAVEKDA